MRVICIDDKWKDFPGYGKVTKSPKFGEIVTVSKAYKDNSMDWYQFQEYGPCNEYEQCGFSPISEIDETTFERNYQKETV